MAQFLLYSQSSHLCPLLSRMLELALLIFPKLHYCLVLGYIATRAAIVSMPATVFFTHTMYIIMYMYVHVHMYKMGTGGAYTPDLPYEPI